MVKPFTMHSSMGVSSMRIKHYQDTDTLYIELRPVKVAESRDLNENTLLDLDKDGAICGITIEHASKQVEISDCSFENLSSFRHPLGDDSQGNEIGLPSIRRTVEN